MAIAMFAKIPGGTAEMYDALNEAIGVTPDNLPDGLISHYTGPLGEDKWIVFDVWESQEDFERFAETQLKPAMEKVAGADAPPMEPRFVPLYNEFHAARVRV